MKMRAYLDLLVAEGKSIGEFAERAHLSDSMVYLIANETRNASLMAAFDIEHASDGAITAEELPLKERSRRLLVKIRAREKTR